MGRQGDEILRPESIIGVIVTFHPDNELRSRVKLIRPQIGRLVIVDNNSSYECKEMIRTVAAEFDADLIENEANLGIASALNSGFKFARSIGPQYEWVLTLDQDSICAPNLVRNLIDSYKHCPFKDRVGIIGSNYKEKTTNKLLHSKNASHEYWDEVRNLPTSGCILRLDAYLEVGEFRTEYFIDYVDTEYCIRLRRLGYRVIISPKVGMIHPLGYYRNSKFSKFLFAEEKVSNYPAFRHYYWTRNGLSLIREYWRDDIGWALIELKYLLFNRLILVMLLEENKLSKIFNIFLGVFHFIIGRSGIKK
jgi:rhamnosyltransferase